MNNKKEMLQSPLQNSSEVITGDETYKPTKFTKCPITSFLEPLLHTSPSLHWHPLFTRTKYKSLFHYSIKDFRKFWFPSIRLKKFRTGFDFISFTEAAFIIELSQSLEAIQFLSLTPSTSYPVGWTLHSAYLTWKLKVLRNNQSNFHEGLVPSDFLLCKQLFQTLGVGGGGERKELVNLANAVLVYSFSKSKKCSRYELLKLWVSYQASLSTSRIVDCGPTTVLMLDPSALSLVTSISLLGISRIIIRLTCMMGVHSITDTLNLTHMRWRMRHGC